MQNTLSLLLLPSYLPSASQSVSTVTDLMILCLYGIYSVRAMHLNTLIEQSIMEYEWQVCPYCSIVAYKIMMH